MSNYDQEQKGSSEIWLPCVGTELQFLNSDAVTYRRGDLSGHSQILAAAKSVQIHSEMAMAQWTADHPYKRGFQEVHKKWN